MKLGLNLGFITSQNPNPVPLAVVAEHLGYDSVWVAEAWGSDAVTLLSWIGAKTTRIGLGSAILQIPSRSPALTAMTAASLDRLSEGRLLLGLGMSGPQVVEGWHGVAYGRPVRRTREVIEIVRKVIARQQPLTYDGQDYQIPYAGGTGLGKPLKLMMAPERKEIPIYIAAIGPNNVALAAEIADGWLPVFYAPEHRNVFEDSLDRGRKRRPPERDELGFDIAPSVGVAIGEDLQACLDTMKPNLALYIGGMGAKGKNFYNDLACRYGYEQEAAQIQDLYLAGDKRAAIAAVPDTLADAVSLCGPKERIRDRASLWKESGVTTLIASASDPETAKALPELLI